MKITPEQLGRVFNHVDSSQDEVCGWLKLKDGVVEEIHPATNVADFPTALYVMDPDSLQLEASVAYTEDAEIVVYHSHPNSTPVPSGIDTYDAILHPHDWRYLIVGKDEFALWSLGPGHNYEQYEVTVTTPGEG